MELLIDASLRSLAVAGLAALAAWRRPAALGHAVWSAALIAMLLMPALVTALPELPIAVWPAVQQAAPPEAPVAQGQALPGRPATPAPDPWWPQALVLAYSAIAMLFALRLAIAFAAALRVARHGERVLDFRALQLAEGCEVYETDAARVPVTVGSRIILPRVWREWDDAVLAAALAHEAAHVRRRDWWFALVAGLNRCVFWFHPVAWWLERRLSDLAEQAADDASLLATGNRRAYARLLVEMAQTVQGGRRMAWEALAMARPSGVSRRVEAALDETRRLSAGLGRAAAAAVLAGAAVLVFGIGAARLVAQQPEAPHVSRQPVTMIGPGATQHLAADAVTQAEGKVASNPDDFTARESLIRHYWMARNAEKWKEHVSAYIERWPESQPAGSPQFRRFPESSSVDADLRALWDRAVQRRPNDPRVLVNAAFNRLDAGEMDEAEGLIDRALQVDPKNSLALFALSRMYVQALTSGGPLGERAKRELETTTNPLLLKLVLTQLRAAGPGEPLGDLLNKLKERHQQLDPSAPPLPPPPPQGGVPGGVVGGVPGGVVGGVPRGGGTPTSFASSVPRTEGVQRIRVGGNVQATKLKSAVRPEYPPVAKQARIQGVVKFEVIIGPDGSISRMFVQSGHPLLVPAAQEAVQKWQWEPTLLNGIPVEVVTVVDVAFSLGSQI